MLRQRASSNDGERAREQRLNFFFGSHIHEMALNMCERARKRDVYGALEYSMCDTVFVSFAATEDEQRRRKEAEWLFFRVSEPSRGHFCGYIITPPYVCSFLKASENNFFMGRENGGENYKRRRVLTFET